MSFEGPGTKYITDALDWAIGRSVVLPGEFYATRHRAARNRMATVSGLAALDQIQGVMDAAHKALENGQTLLQFEKEASAAGILGLPKHRRELIFRNAMQSAYGAGRELRQRNNARRRPFLMWDAINDSRTRPTHRAMDGHVAPIDDPIWQEWRAPAGFNCRCTQISLTERQARDRGYEPGNRAPEDTHPDKGWAGSLLDNTRLERAVQARKDICGLFARALSPLWCINEKAIAFVQSLEAKLIIDPHHGLDAEFRKLIGARRWTNSVTRLAERGIFPEGNPYGLSLAEMVAMHQWTAPGKRGGTALWRELNTVLHGNKLGQRGEDLLTFASLLLSALDKLPRYGGTVYRFVDSKGIPGGDQFWRQLHDGDEAFNYVGMTGATKHESPLEDEFSFDTVIAIKNGETGKDISELSYYPDQGEILFPHGVTVIPLSRNDDLARMFGVEHGYDVAEVPNAEQ